MHKHLLMDGIHWWRPEIVKGEPMEKWQYAYVLFISIPVKQEEAS